MRILSAEFVKGATCRAEWPDDARPEIALCGRSNVGKSSLLNTLLHRKGLARVSKTPGRTRLLNFFTVNFVQAQAQAKSELLVTDLPGFGYAEVGRQERDRWRKMMEEYLSQRRNLRAVVMLFDARRVLDARAEELLFDETELLQYLHDLGRAVIPVITKADKLSKHERKPAAMALGRLVGRAVTIYSSQSGEGQAELLRRIGASLRQKPASAATNDEAPGEAEHHESDPV